MAQLGDQTAKTQSLVENAGIQNLALSQSLTMIEDTLSRFDSIKVSVVWELPEDHPDAAQIGSRFREWASKLSVDKAAGDAVPFIKGMETFAVGDQVRWMGWDLSTSNPPDLKQLSSFFRYLADLGLVVAMCKTRMDIELTEPYRINLAASGGPDLVTIPSNPEHSAIRYDLVSDKLLLVWSDVEYDRSQWQSTREIIGSNDLKGSHVLVYPLTFMLETSAMQLAQELRPLGVCMQFGSTIIYVSEFDEVGSVNFPLVSFTVPNTGVVGKPLENVGLSEECETHLFGKGGGIPGSLVRVPFLDMVKDGESIRRIFRYLNTKY